MGRRTRIYYTGSQRALMWERWKAGWTLHQIGHLFDPRDKALSRRAMTSDGHQSPIETTRPVRVQLSRKKGWRMPPNTAKVDRSTKWGNPFAVGQPFRRHGAHTSYVVDREHAVDLFRRAITGNLSADLMHYDPQVWEQYVARARRDLRGKNLACWCPIGQPCHAAILLEIANS